MTYALLISFLIGVTYSSLRESILPFAYWNMSVWRPIVSYVASQLFTAAVSAAPVASGVVLYEISDSPIVNNSSVVPVRLANDTVPLV